jgi:hypothetical protein
LGLASNEGLGLPTTRSAHGASLSCWRGTFFLAPCARSARAFASTEKNDPAKRLRLCRTLGSCQCGTRLRRLSWAWQAKVHFSELCQTAGRSRVFEASPLGRAVMRQCATGSKRGLTFELRRDRRRDARPDGWMINKARRRAWWLAVGPRLERGVRRRCVHAADQATLDPGKDSEGVQVLLVNCGQMRHTARMPSDRLRTRSLQPMRYCLLGSAYWPPAARRKPTAPCSCLRANETCSLHS